MTYLTPTYLAIGYFAMVSALSNLDHTVSIFLHDNNLLTHQRSRREVFGKSNTSISKYIEYTIEEIEILLSTLNANMKKVKIIKASDMWAALSQNKSDFFAFYGLLGDIKYDKSTKGIGEFYSAAYHAIQRPFDIYFARNYSKISKLDVKNPEFMIIPYDRLASYSYIRNKMIASPTTASQHITSPLFCTTKPSFTFSFNDTIPSCKMNIQEVEHIVNASKPKAQDNKLTFNNIVIPISEFLNKMKIMDKPLTEVASLKNHQMVMYIYEMMESVWEHAKENSNVAKNDVYVTSKFNFDAAKEVISSTAILKTLVCCNGELTVSEIAKKLGQHISNTSAYMSKLRRLGLITADQKPRIRFNRLIIDIAAIANVEG